MTTIGVLALQGAFARPQQILAELGITSKLVRNTNDLENIDALILPGGESTTMSMMLDSSGLFEPIKQLIQKGIPVFGTCAGMILLSNNILDGREDQKSFGAIDVSVRRNAYGRQKESFTQEIGVDGLDSPFFAVFIRAPVIERVEDSVDVLASLDDHPVLCRSANVFASTFHPELSEDTRIHEMFLQKV